MNDAWREKIANAPESFKARNPHLYRPDLEPRQWEDREIDILKAACSDPTIPVNIALLAGQFNRSYASVALKISRLGLGSRTRKESESTAQRSSEITKRWWLGLTEEQKDSHRARLVLFNKKSFLGKHHSEENKKLLSDKRIKWLSENPHPKGFLGKKHSTETKANISKLGMGRKVSRASTVSRMKTCLAKYGKTVAANVKGRKARWKAQWVEVGGKRFFARSQWEANYGRYLEFLKVKTKEITEWSHEPDVFWFDGIKRGCVSYLPDFKVLNWDGSTEYHEVKGWMDQRSRTAIKRMGIYHPQIKLVIIDGVRYKALQKTCCKLVPDWNAPILIKPS